MITTALALLLAFLMGSIPTALLMGRAKGIDIRQHGSGNIGATNAFRVLGKSWGITCLVLDALKGWLPVTLFTHVLFAHPEIPGWAWIVGIAAIMGHMFSPWVGWRGGKGVATSLGVMLAIVTKAMLVTLAVGLAIIGLTGYVSLASITGSILLPILVLAFDWRQGPWASFIITALVGGAIVWKHRANIQRLREGTEKRIFHAKKDGANNS